MTLLDDTQFILAIGAGKVDALREHIDEDRSILDKLIGNTPWQCRAVEAGQKDVLVYFVDTLGLDLAVRDKVGRGLIQLAASIRVESGDLAATIDALIARGARVDTRDDNGDTAISSCIKAGNLARLKTLLEKPGGDTYDAPDSLGWTLVDMAIGAGQAEIEAWARDNGYGADDDVVGEDEVGPISTVDVLCRVTKVIPDVGEDEEERDALARCQGEVRGFFEELYAFPEFRTVLDLAAADALGTRGGDGRKGLRVYLNFNSDQAGSITGKGGYGAFDPDANTIVLGAKRAHKDLGGTLIHELTHHAADVVFEDLAVPFSDSSSDEAEDYIRVVNEAAKTAHRFHGPGVGEVSQVITGRLSTYSARGSNQTKKRRAVLQEYIVGIPQSIYTHGAAIVDEVAPDLKGWFDGTFETQCSDKLSHLEAFQDLVDNDDLIEELPDPPRPPLPAPAWLSCGTEKGKGLQVPTDITSMLFKEILAHRGRDYDPSSIDDRAKGLVPTGTDELPLYTSTTSMPTTLSRDEENALNSALSKALRPMVSELPDEVSQEVLADLLTCVDFDPDDPTDIDEAVLQATTALRKTIRSAKISYLGRAKETDKLDKKLLVTTLVEEAAWIALDASGRTVDPAGTPDFKSSKFTGLVTDLMGELSDELLADLAGTPAALLHAAHSLASGTDGGIFTKGHTRKANKILGQAVTHVSIDRTAAKRTWVRELAQYL